MSKVILTKKEWNLVVEVATAESYGIIKKIVFRNKEEVANIVSLIEEDETLLASYEEYQEFTKNLDRNKEIDRLWRFIDNLSDNAAEILDYNTMVEDNFTRLYLKQRIELKENENSLVTKITKSKDYDELLNIIKNNKKSIASICDKIDNKTKLSIETNITSIDEEIKHLWKYINNLKEEDKTDLIRAKEVYECFKHIHITNS